MLTVGADQNLFENPKKSKEDFARSKCVDTVVKYKELLSYEEICKYGFSCPKRPFKDKQPMYCVHKNISECFEKKSWQTSNQIVGLPLHIKIGLLTQGLSFKKGANSGKTCAYYN